MWGSCWGAGDLELDGDATDADELAAADEEADARASRKTAATPSSASFADAFAEILAHPGPAGGQAAPILAVRGGEIHQHPLAKQCCEFNIAMCDAKLACDQSSFLHFGRQAACS